MSVNGNEYGLFWNSEGGDRKYNAESFEMWLKKFFTSGVFADELQVTATSGMEIAVSGGYSNTDGKVMFFGNTTTFTLATASASNPRIDTVVVERNDGDRAITLKVVQGAYAAEPVATAPVREDGVYQLVLAEIYVGQAASTITQANITDKRQDTTVCGYITGTVEEMDYSQFAAQFASYYENFTEENQAEFEDWFQHMKDQLSTDAAGHLQAEIDNINGVIPSNASPSNKLATMNDVSQRIKIAPSTASGSYTYDGTEKTVVWSNYDPTKIEIQGTQSATNAGTYTCTAVLKDSYNYCWTDGTNAPIQVTWTIEKAASPMTISQNAVRIVENGEIIISTNNAKGIVTTSSSDISVAFATIVDTNKVKIEWMSVGTCTVTVNDSGDANYNSGSKTISVTCVLSSIYGVEWAGTSTTSWTRTDDSALFSDPSPAVNNGNGSSPFDNCYPWSDIERRTDAECGEMVYIPKFWVSVAKDGTKMNIRIADNEIDGFTLAPAFQDAGDGRGELDYILVARYPSGNDKKSATGVTPIGNMTRATARAYARSLGNDVYLMDYATLQTLWYLYIVEYADWNSENKIGYGGGNGSMGNTGSSDNMLYHTGTKQSNRTTAGLGIQYRYIEGLWENIFYWVDGIRFSGSDVFFFKNPNNYDDTSGGTKVGVRPVSNGVISAYNLSSDSNFVGYIYPSAVSGSSGTHVTDNQDYNASGTVLICGCYYNRIPYSKLFYLGTHEGATDKAAHIGMRIIKRPS